MKICILQGAFFPVPPSMGGAVEKMWYLLGQKFAARRHEVVHISRRWGDFPDRERILGVEHLRVDGYESPASLVWLKVLDALYTLRAVRAIPRDADIVVTNTFWAPLLVPLFRRARIYVDVARMPKGQMRWYGAAARLRATSSPVAAAIREELPQRRHGSVCMIPNPLPYVAERAADMHNKRKSILYCGRIHPEKGLELLVDAVRSLPEDWTLRIVGPWKIAQGGGGGVYLESLKARFDPHKVRFVEPVYDIAKLNQLYEEAAIFVYPSVAEKGETFGLAPLEAMAWGAVPLVSDLACFKDFIVDQDNGLVFDHRAPDAGSRLAACLMQLIDDKATRLAMGYRALNVRATHAPELIADQFLADFERLRS